MKLLTSLAALDTLDPTYTWRTGVYYTGTLQAGVLHGNLILRGGGDPGLNDERFLALLRDIQALGVRHIQGDVILDNSLYGIEPGDPAAFDLSPLKPYNAEPAALLVNYNSMTLRIGSLAGKAVAQLDPDAWPLDSSGLRLDASAPCEGWQERFEVDRDAGAIILTGSYPSACGARTLWVNVMCPAANSAVYFKRDWQTLGGSLSGQLRLGGTPAEARLLIERESPPLSALVRDINTFSNNVMAKMLFLNLGVARYGAPATWEKGQAAILSWLAERTIEAPGLVVENGSGLSRLERMTPATVARLLAWAARQPLYYDFAASLPALGLAGTQRHRMQGTAQAGRAWLKSGTLKGVRNLAGYYMDAAGRRHLIVLFIADAPPSEARAIQDAVLEWALGRR